MNNNSNNNKNNNKTIIIIIVVFCIKTQFVIVLYYVTYCAIYFCVEINLWELNTIHIVVYLTMASHTLSCDFEDNANLEALLTKVEAKALHLKLTDTDEAKRITAMFVSELNVETIILAHGGILLSL